MIGNNFRGIAGFETIKLSNLVTHSLAVDAECKGILVINDTPNCSDFDACEALKTLSHNFLYDKEEVIITMVCIVDFSFSYVEEHAWSAVADILDLNSNTWMRYKRTPKVEDDAPDLSKDSIEEYIDINIQHWSMAVFQVVDMKENKNLMEQYLSYMGGQGKVCCPEHKRYPLISVKPRHEFPCTFGKVGRPCAERVVYTCPEKQCQVGICKYHHNEECGLKNEGDYKYTNVEKTVRKTKEIMREKCSLRRKRQLHEINAGEGCDVGREGDEDLTDVEWPHGKGVANDTSESDFDDDSVNMEPVMDKELVLEPRDSDDEKSIADFEQSVLFVPDVDVDETNIINDEEDNDADADDNFLPTTVVGREAITITSNREGISEHVLLNMQGSILTRHGKKLEPNAREQHFMERMVSTDSTKAVSLVYGEGALHPGNFWKSMEDHTIPGAIPTCFMSTGKICDMYNIASIEEHSLNRITNPSFVGSVDPRYISYMWDWKANAMLKGNDDRIILRRGFQDMLGDGAGPRVASAPESHVIKGDFDASRCVKKLAATMREEEGTYFTTHTANQRNHFGLRPLFDALQRWILDINYAAKTESEAREKVRAANISSMTQMVRTWTEVGKLLMKWIACSKEEPLGKIKRLFWRWEFQGKEGNLAHIHALMWLALNKLVQEQMNKIQDKVCCDSRDFLKPDDVEKYVLEGILVDKNDGARIRDVMLRIQLHSCERSDGRCQKQIGKGKHDVVCRVPNHSDRHYCTSFGFEVIPIEQTQKLSKC